MSIPKRTLDIKKLIKNCNPENISDQDILESQKALERDWIAWLSQYDDKGHLKPGIFDSINYIPNMTYEFIRKSEKEKAEFIISEKKRMGIL